MYVRGGKLHSAHLWPRNIFVYYFSNLTIWASAALFSILTTARLYNHEVLWRHSIYQVCDNEMWLEHWSINVTGIRSKARMRVTRRPNINNWQTTVDSQNGGNTDHRIYKQMTSLSPYVYRTHELHCIYMHNYAVTLSLVNVGNVRAFECIINTLVMCGSTLYWVQYESVHRPYWCYRHEHSSNCRPGLCAAINSQSNIHSRVCRDPSLIHHRCRTEYGIGFNEKDDKTRSDSPAALGNDFSADGDS